jgi:predicted CXXCH cytochrome family protein
MRDTKSLKGFGMKLTFRHSVFLLGIMVLMALPAWGRGTGGVENTIHNLSSTNTTFSTYAADNLDEVCAFCHTPHGGSLTGALWNHDLPAADSFTHYNSATLSSTLRALSPARDINSESLLCMACHDGSISVDHLINDPNVLGGAQITIYFGNTNVEIMDFFGIPGSRIGSEPGTQAGTGQLADDHPISFSYDEVLLDPTYAGGSRDGEMRTVTAATNWLGEGVRFFAPGNRVECSSCHDPHVDYITDTAYTPFLIRPNDGSNLCLACHNK